MVSVSSQPVIRCVSPRDGAVKAELPTVDAARVKTMVAAARVAQKAWAARTVRERGKVIRRVHKRFLEKAERFVELLVEETGKPAGEAWTAEIIANGDLFTYWSAHAADYLKRERLTFNPVNYPKKTAFLEYVPRGVVGIIAPWNYPVAIPLRNIVPALMAGNSVVFKPSSQTARLGQLIADIFQAELPPDVFQAVIGPGSTGQAMVEAGIDFLSFTGSVPIGRKMGALCGERLIPCALELGGKDAAIVLADCDLDRTVQGVVWGALTNAGQNCASIERVYVEAAIAPAFIDKAKAFMATLRLGDDVGPLTTDEQRQVVEEQVAAAVKAGATLVIGGRRKEAPGYWYEPTLLTGVTDDMAVMAEETFGPVLPIRVVKDVEEAIQATNSCKYGLTNSVWTGDPWRGMQIARRLESGVVTVNNHSFTGALPFSPWSGVKETGFGATNSHIALMEFVRPRVVVIDRSKKPEMWWYPYNQALIQVTTALRDLALGKLGALPRLLGGFGKRFK